MQIVLHVGMHKTGTSSFQNWLRDNSGNLLDRSIAVFPVDARILANVPVCFDPVSLGKTLSDLERSGIHTVVFSHETLSECFAPDLEKLVNVFYPHQIRYVITVRHWSEFLLSRWMQNCMRRDTQSYVSFVDQLLKNPEGRIEAFYDLPVLRALEVGITDINVVSYGGGQSGNSLLRRLAQTCLLPVDAMTTLENHPKANVSKTPLQADRTRMFNGIAAAACDRALNPMASRSRTGESPDRFFDLQHVVRHILAQNTDLAKRLDHELASSTVDFQLDAKEIGAWQGRVTDVLLPFLAGGRKGRLFPEGKNRCVGVSPLEFSMLPDELRRDMRAALKGERPDLF